MKRALRNLSMLLSFALLVGCGGEIEPGRTTASPPRVKGLKLVTVGVTALAGSQAFVGTLESGDRALLTAQIDGRVGRLMVREGDVVRSGELLLSIEQSTASARLAEAEGGERAAAARMELAEQTYRRYEQLRQAEAVTPHEFDQIAAERESARQARQSAQALVAQARTGVAHTRIVAPYAGRVAQRLVESGSTVQPGTPLLALDREGDWQARLDLPESWLAKVKLGDALLVEIPALGRTLSGRVKEIVPAADPHSRSFVVKVGLAEQNGLSAGLFVRAARRLDLAETLLAPASAVTERGQLTGVYVVEQGILHYRLVKIGRRIGEQLEILSGLTPGETVVSEGVTRAVNGAQVEN